MRLKGPTWSRIRKISDVLTLLLDFFADGRVFASLVAIELDPASISLALDDVRL